MVMHKPKNKLFLTDSYKSSLISALNEEYPETGMECGVDNTGRKPYEWEFNPTFTSIRKAVERETYELTYLNNGTAKFSLPWLDMTYYISNPPLLQFKSNAYVQQRIIKFKDNGLVIVVGNRNKSYVSKILNSVTEKEYNEARESFESGVKVHAMVVPSHDFGIGAFLIDLEPPEVEDTDTIALMGEY